MMYGGESVLLFKNETTNQERGIKMNLMVEGKITTIGDLLGILLICVLYSITFKDLENEHIESGPVLVSSSGKHCRK